MEDGKYFYKATFHLRNRKALLRLLTKYDQQGLGGIMMDEIQESLPNYEKSIEVPPLFHQALYYPRFIRTSDFLKRCIAF